MKHLGFFLFVLAIAGCSALPEQGPPTETLRGTLTFREMTALPTTATAHITIAPTLAGGGSEPVAQQDFPAKTGTAIPFAIEIPADKLAAGGDYLVLAQVLDHGKVWYSNLSAPMRISFAAEPTNVVIELRKER